MKTKMLLWILGVEILWAIATKFIFGWSDCYGCGYEQPTLLNPFTKHYQHDGMCIMSCTVTFDPMTLIAVDLILATLIVLFIHLVIKKLKS